MINARNNPHSESTPQNVELPAFVRIDASVGKKDFPYCHFFRQPDQQKIGIQAVGNPVWLNPACVRRGSRPKRRRRRSICMHPCMTLENE